MTVELSGVEPRGWPLNAEMVAFGGPSAIGSGGRGRRSDVVWDAGEETPSEMAARFGRLVHYEEGDGIRPVTDGNEVEMIGHEGVLKLTAA